MKTGRKQVIVTLVTALVVTLITVSAHATEHYVLTCVGNETNVPLNYDLQDAEAPRRPQPHLSRTYTY
jgi:hypothetical protein